MSFPEFVILTTAMGVVMMVAWVWVTERFEAWIREKSG